MCAGDDDEWTRGRSHSGLSFTNRDSGDKQNQNINQHECVCQCVCVCGMCVHGVCVPVGE